MSSERYDELVRFQKVLLDATPAFIYTYDQQGLFRSANRATCQFLRQPEDSLVGRRLTDFLSPAAALGFAERTRQLLVRGEIATDVEVLAPGGERRVLRLQNRCLQTPGETLFLGTAIDVTAERRAQEALAASESRLQSELAERRQAESEIRRLNIGLEARVLERTSDLSAAYEALRRSEQFLRSILEAEPEGIAVLDAAARMLTVNPAACRMLGMATAGEVRGRPFEPWIGAPHRQAFHAFWGRVLAGGHHAIELECRGHDGVAWWADAHAVLLAGGEHRRVLLVMRDVTEHRQAEQQRLRLRSAIERSASEWQATFDAVQSPLLLLDEHGLLHRCNEAARRALGGHDYSAMLGRSLQAEAAGGLWPQVQDAAAAALKQGQPQLRQVREGQTTWEVSVNAVSSVTPRLIAALVVDVTPVVELQESLRRARNLSLIGSLVAGVAHEVRNPLFALSASVDGLEHSTGDEGERARYFQNLRRAMARVERLMQELLDYSRPGVRVLSSGTVGEVIEEARQGCEDLLRDRRLTVRVQIDPRCGGEFAMDPERLVQVFRNLIENAAHFSPRGSEIAIDTELAGESVKVTVRDSGPGIPESDLERMFEPLFSTREGGVGLGLAISQRIVEDHGGTITASNRPEGGAAILVLLPTARNRRDGQRPRPRTGALRKLSPG